jgi:ParB family chromosome partitioning protein
VPIDLIDEPMARDNARRVYRPEPIAELAGSIREEGILQPLCVRPEGQRFRVVYGLRRLRAAREAHLTEVPCTIRVLEDDRAFLINLVENLHRQQLSGPERVRAIERLAATGLGVRGIARRTGFNASTVSRWLRIGENQLLRAAVEEERVDITRAKILVQVPETALPDLLARAASMSVAALRAEVTDAPRQRTTASNAQRALQLLASVTCAQDPHLVHALRQQVDRLASLPPRA